MKTFAQIIAFALLASQAVAAPVAAAPVAAGAAAGGLNSGKLGAILGAAGAGAGLLNFGAIKAGNMRRDADADAEALVNFLLRRDADAEPADMGVRLGAAGAAASLIPLAYTLFHGNNKPAPAAAPAAAPKKREAEPEAVNSGKLAAILGAAGAGAGLLNFGAIKVGNMRRDADADAEALVNFLLKRDADAEPADMGVRLGAAGAAASLVPLAYTLFHGNNKSKREALTVEDLVAFSRRDLLDL